MIKIHLPILFTLMIVFFTPVNGQDSVGFSNHFGINILSVNYVSENYIPNGYKIIFPIGMSYKKDYQRIAARYSINYNRIKTEYEETWIDGYSGYNYYTTWSISSGIQKNLNYGKLCIYYGMDLFSYLSIYRVDYDGGFSGGGMHEKYYHFWAGLGPIAGFQINLLPRLTLSLETSYNFAFRIINTDPELYESVNSFQHYINPIKAITIFYNF